MPLPSTFKRSNTTNVESLLPPFTSSYPCITHKLPRLTFSPDGRTVLNSFSKTLCAIDCLPFTSPNASASNCQNFCQPFNMLLRSLTCLLRITCLQAPTRSRVRYFVFNEIYRRIMRISCPCKLITSSKWITCEKRNSNKRPTLYTYSY